MLQAIRDRSQGLIVGVIVFLISLTFVLVGVQGYLSGDSDVVVANVQGEEIFLSQFQTRIQELKRRTEELTGQESDVDFWTTSAVKNKTLNQLIDEKVLDQLLEQNLFMISDEQIATRVREIEAFKEDGNFSRELYRRMLSLNGLTVSAFENGMRQDLIRSRLRAGLLGSEFVTNEEAMFIYRLQRQTRDIGFTIIPRGLFSEELKIEESDIESYFEKNSENFRSLEKLSVSYLEISREAIVEKLDTPDDEMIKNLYQSSLDSYRIPEKRRVEHILLANSASLDPNERGEIVQSLLARFEGGESIDSILSSSEDAYEVEGGTTDYFERGMMAPRFEDEAFTLEINEVSNPFTSQFGVHLVKVIGIEKEQIPDLETVYDDVMADFKLTQAEEELLEMADRLSEMAYEEPNTLSSAAESLQLEIKETPLLDRTELGEKFSPSFANKIFQPEVLFEGLNSDLVELPDGRLVVARVTSHSPSAIPDLEDARERVEAGLRSMKERDASKKFGESLLDDMRSGKTLSEIKPRELDLTWEVKQAVDLEDGQINPQILLKSFGVTVADNNPVYFGFELVNGDYAVVRVSNVVIPPPESITSGEAALAEEEMLRTQAASIWEYFSKLQRVDHDIEIYQDRL